ncbi:LysR family transcriptional regulator [Aurantimonas sp. MSK8Z-1]|uniref:LysR family transcriptional regulator n=1 Tax=Mangrovibrevibacter kandeliae TaxID=2968473 RepID=UPI0021190B4C|nr:LysR family transcriptional regulator [Aurantimonas sp. MSK8Z-1]MCW4115524.1 LysR family transcriptional regulator [Aurantimonas sp. MSK8Z-1]
MNFAALDLNLLRVFDAMMLDLSTVRAGERIGLSQPAVSAALGRLRHVTGDELFVREGNRMVATPRALELQTPIRAALGQVETALAQVTGFEPATSERRFTILGSDYFSAILMPQLARQVAPHAPQVLLQMLDFPNAQIAPLLAAGRIDLALGRDLDMPDWVASRTVFRSHLLCVARKGHPQLAAQGIGPGETIPPELFCALRQVLMSMDGGTSGTADAALAEQGLWRRVAMTVPHFQAVALTAAASDLVGNLPLHFALRVATILPLDLYLPPINATAGVGFFWHRRMEKDPANRWLREEVEAARTAIDAAVPRHYRVTGP